MSLFRQRSYFFRYVVTALLVIVRSSVNAQVTQADSPHRMYVSTDTSLQYSLYLPAGYEREKKYPLIIFLDPAARGELPVTKYRAIADEYGIIFAGSYSSRNFDPSASTISIASIYDDLLAKYAIDTSRIWLAGFSGGARMATSFAGNYSEIKGVIACGAGFTGERVIGTQRKIPFAGIVGTADMNYEEMLGINDYLNAAGNENLLALFDGLHQWPPPGYFGVAVCWLMKTGKFPGEVVATTCSAIAGKIVNYKDSGFLYPAWLAARELKKIPGFNIMADSLQQLAGSAKEFKHDQAAFLAALNDERKYMDAFSILFNQAIFTGAGQADSATVWAEKADVINRMRKTKKSYTLLSANRCFDFSWRLCIEYYFQFMNLQQYAQAYKAAYIISFFPTGENNPDYLMARAAAGFSDRKLCLKHLRQAVKNATIKEERVLADPLVMNLIGKDTVDKLFKELKDH